ncbi:MAG TPA: hypothetical protein ENI73_05025 [Spirochaetes bacterium]|nr:hypothetical protein [Spirochaetota bacterium]
MTIKVLNTIFSLLFLIILLSCEQKKTTLGKVEMILEIDLTDPEEPENPCNEENANKLTEKQLEKERLRNLAKVNLILSPLARYFGDSIYVRSNGRIRKIIKVNISGEEALVLSSAKLEPKILRLTDGITNNKSPNKKGDLVPIKFKQFPFDTILDMAPSKNGEIYVMNFYDPSEKIVYKPDSNDNKKKKPKKKEEKKAKKTNESDLAKYIFKFNSHGEFLYKIGKAGKVTGSTTGKSFAGNQQINKMACDQYNNLCLILQSFNQKAKTGSPYSHDQYEFYRFTSTGKRDMYIGDLNKFLPIEKGYTSQIEKIEITPVSEKLLFQVAYYPKIKKKSSVSQKIAYKKLILVSLKDPSNDSKVVKILKGPEIHYTIFEVIKNDNIYLYIPPPNRKTANNTKELKKEFTFQVINKNGSNVEEKKVTLNPRPDDELRWFTLGKNGRVIIFIKTKTKLLVIFKKE